MNKLIRANKEVANDTATANILKRILKNHFPVVKVNSVEDDLISIDVTGRGNMAFITGDFVTKMYKLQVYLLNKHKNFNWSAVPISTKKLNFVFRF